MTLNADGSFTYTPAAGFTGTDSFTYLANDGALDSNAATVTIEVRAGLTDLDIAQFKATHRASLGNFRGVKLTVVIKNNGTVDVEGTATVVGTQNEVPVYTSTFPVSDPTGNGRTRYIFIVDLAAFYPKLASGDLNWTATLSVPGDVDPLDEATAMTRIVE